MSLDPQVIDLLAKVKALGRPEYWELGPEGAREAHNDNASRLSYLPRDLHRVEELIIPGPGASIPARLYQPGPGCEKLPVLVWLHGGGHVIGNIGSYDALCREIAYRSNCMVVSIEYRLAPEHKFPAAIEDAFTALQWVATRAEELGADPTRIAVGGDSAGGNLAAVCAILARDQGGPNLRFQLLIYPATAPHSDSQSQFQFAEGHFLTRQSILWFHQCYLRDDEDRKDFRYAPLIADSLANLPPALVIVAGHDPLRDEGIAYAERLQSDGNIVKLSNYEGMIHAFFSLSRILDKTDEAVDEVAQALRQAFDTGV